jgi:hypothetical protein
MLSECCVQTAACVVLAVVVVAVVGVSIVHCRRRDRFTVLENTCRRSPIDQMAATEEFRALKHGGTIDPTVSF